MRLMFDLQVLALETDMTRIISFKTGRDAQEPRLPGERRQPAVPSDVHHGDREDRIMDFNKIKKFRVGQVPYLLDRLKASQDGDSNLLEKTLVIWGSPMADPNVHNHRRCPLILLGHGNGMLKGNMHIKAADATPMANAFLTIAHGLGMEDVKSFGDSTGEQRSRRACLPPPPLRREACDEAPAESSVPVAALLTVSLGAAQSGPLTDAAMRGDNGAVGADQQGVDVAQRRATA